MRARLRRCFDANVEEIAQDWVLRAFGACVAATYILTALYWLTVDMRPVLAAGTDAACWPGLSFCRDIRWLGESGVTIYLASLLLVSCAAAVLFARRRTVKWALVLVIACVVMKAYFMSLDYRTRLNQHYMAFFATVAFLFIPRKRDAVRLLVVLFYFWAGAIKLNHEWMSGAALYGEIWLFDGALLRVMCVYVIVLELAIVWLLLTKNRWAFWATFAQLAAFHLFSFELVGFFYPTLMYLLLMIFVLCFVAESGQGDSLMKRLWGGRVGRGALAFALATSLLQLTPHLYSGDPAITGEGRLLGLHMFDARVHCDGYAVVRTVTGEERSVRPERSFRRSVRMRCDPNIYINFAINLCGRVLPDFGRVSELDLRLTSRKATDGTWHEVIDHESFCTHPLRFNALLPNDWMVRR